MGCKHKPIGIAGLQEIIKKRELHLVEYKYNDVIFLYKHDDENKKMVMVVKYPVSVSAAVDLKNIVIDTVGKKIKISNPFLKEPIIDFTKAEPKTVRDGFVISFGGRREDLITSLQNRMMDTQKRIKEDAVKLGILIQAKEEATSFLKDLLTYFTPGENYTIEFVDSTNSSLPDETVKPSITPISDGTGQFDIMTIF